MVSEEDPDGPICGGVRDCYPGLLSGNSADARGDTRSGALLALTAAAGGFTRERHFPARYGVKDVRPQKFLLHPLRLPLTPQTSSRLQNL